MDTARLFQALAFAADKHEAQRRKNASASPYINHPIAVASVLVSEASVDDEPTILAALLHDTVEDTDTSPEELERMFGVEVTALVAEVTDDKSLPKRIRKQLQITHAASASRKAKLVKVADKICNVRDVTSDPPGDWSRKLRREYLDWAEQVVAGCRGIHQGLDTVFDRALAAGREALDASPPDDAAEHGRAHWAIWYRDAFDRDAAPRVDAEGDGLLRGLEELWARYLFESVGSGGTQTFSRFHLSWLGGTAAVSGDAKGAKRLREWMFGEKRAASAGYVREADRQILQAVADAHLRAVGQLDAANEILSAARECAGPKEFLERIDPAP